MTEQVPLRSAQFSLSRLPYPIALPLRHAYEAPNASRGLSLLLHSYGNVLRFIGICSTADYLRHPSIHTETGDNVVRDLRRPALGHWFRAARDLPPLIDPNLFNDCLTDWPRVTAALSLRRTSSEHPRIRTSGAEALLALRNEMAHGVPPDEEASRQLLARNTPIFEQILDSLPFMSELSVCRPIEVVGDDVLVLELRGPTEPFMVKRIPTTACEIPDPGALPDCLIGPSLCRKYIDLTPLLLAPASDPAGERRCPQELLVYDGIGRRRVYYLGPVSRVEDRTHYQRVVDVFYGSATTHKGWMATPALATVKRQTIETIDAYLGSKYLPGLYLPRPAMDELIAELVKPNSRVAGLLIAAESGAGKTSLMCATASEMLASEKEGALPLLVLGREIGFTADGTASTLRQFLARISGCPPHGDWPEFLEELGRALGRLGTDAGSPLLLLLDAVNEAADPEALLLEFDSLVSAARGLSWVRCAATIRQEALARVRQRFAATDVTWPRASRAYIREPDEAGNVKPYCMLKRLSVEETKAAFEIAQAYARSEKQPVFEREFDELPDAIKFTLRQPLFLRLFLSTYASRDVPSQLSALELFATYHELSLTPDIAALADRIAGVCANQENASLKGASVTPADDLGDREVWMVPGTTVLDRLLDEGVLLRLTDDSYAFAQQKYLEYLLFRRLRATVLDDDAVIAQIEAVCTRDNVLEESRGALQWLCIALIKDGRINLAAKLGGMEGDQRTWQFLLPVLAEVRQFAPGAYDIFVRAARRSVRPDQLRFLTDLLRTLGDHESELEVIDRLMPLESEPGELGDIMIRRAAALISLNRCEQASADAAAAGKIAITYSLTGLALDSYVARGYIGFVTGRSDDALKAYAEAERVLDAHSDGFSDDRVATKRWAILTGRGCVQHNMEANRDCLSTHLVVCDIARQLKSPTNLAMSLVNLADAYWGCHKYEQAVTTYDEAIDRANRSCYRDAEDIALIGRGTVLWSLAQLYEAEQSISKGLVIAEELQCEWDIAYGRVYLSNVWASLGDLDRAISLNMDALDFADAKDLSYPAALAAAYLSWKRETLAPGARETLAFIESSLQRTEKGGLTGPAIMLRGVRLLNRLGARSIPERDVDVALRVLVQDMQALEFLKGPWERLGRRIVGAARHGYPTADILPLQDLIDEVTEAKIAQMPLVARRGYVTGLGLLC